MKKYLLSLLIAGLTFIGFSSAVNVSCNYDSAGGGMLKRGGGGDSNLTCDPSGIDSIYLNNFTISFDFDLEDFIGVIDDDLTIYLTDGGKNQIPILYCNQIEEECYNYDITVNTYEDINTSYNGNSLEYKIEYQGFGNFDFDFSYTITDNEENVDEPGTGGNETPPVNPDNPGQENNNNGLVAGGINAFSGIITRLGSIFGEFGPYIIYIAIACLGISLLFKALKSLLGFTDNKTKKSIGGREGIRKRKRLNKGGYIGMRARRTRRRRNRRFVKAVNKYEGGFKNEKPKFGQRGYNSRRY